MEWKAKLILTGLRPWGSATGSQRVPSNPLIFFRLEVHPDSDTGINSENRPAQTEYLPDQSNRKALGMSVLEGYPPCSYAVRRRRRAVLVLAGLTF